MEHAATFEATGHSVNRATDSSRPIAEEFLALTRGHSQLLYRIALAVGRNPQDAEDAVQDTLLQLYRSGNWNHIEDIRGYLARAVWRAAIRNRRGRPVAEELPAHLTATSPTPEQDAMDRQRESQLHALIDGLPDTLRIPLALAALGELKLTEVAAMLDLPEGTVRRRIHTARQRLRERWNEIQGNEKLASGGQKGESSGPF